MRAKLIVSTIIVAIGILLIAGAINTDVEAIAPTQISDCDDSSNAFDVVSSCSKSSFDISFETIRNNEKEAP